MFKILCTDNKIL